MPAIGQDDVSKRHGTTTMYQITNTSTSTTTTTNNNNNNPKSDGEYTDQELLNLVNYFEVSRVDLKNVRG